MADGELFLKTNEEQLFSRLISGVVAKADGFTGEGFMVQTVPSVTHVTDVAEGGRKPPRLKKNPDSEERSGWM
jgi:hypothetical protein